MCADVVIAKARDASILFRSYWYHIIWYDTCGEVFKVYLYILILIVASFPVILNSLIRPENVH